MKIFTYPALILLLASTTACNSSNPEGEPTVEGETQDAPKNQEGEYQMKPADDFDPSKPYEHESGTIEYKYSGSIEGMQSFKFDDYGKTYVLEEKYTNKESPDKREIHQLFIQKEDESYYINMKTKSGYKIEGIDTASRSNMLVDFIRLGIDSTMKKNGFAYTGTKKVADQVCRTYSSGGVEFCFDGAVNVKSNYDLGEHLKYTLEATNIDYGARVSASSFQLPDGVNIMTKEQYTARSTTDKL